ncbi:hypothetical protein ANN_22789 [Periplaneta americana]|uniref:Uncharacterized protein n=1 Tax=Periplaneta americana TaxID=6978 RepID=A0ABQ8SKF9_PERAM|nr:hypothetical protein ANN_22789 [Periplaneta americana]
MRAGSSTESYPAFARIGLRENPGKNLNQAVRAIPGRTLSTTRCRHPDCSELETLGHVLGQCPKGELLINARHHRVRHALAISLKTLNWEIHEEVHCVSSDGSFRRADIIAINGRLKRALVLDPTIRFERNLNQATEVDIEKKSIYEPCLPYLSQKYNVPLKQRVFKNRVLRSGVELGMRDKKRGIHMDASCSAGHTRGSRSKRPSQFIKTKVRGGQGHAGQMKHIKSPGEAERFTAERKETDERGGICRLVELYTGMASTDSIDKGKRTY